jgi:hypothetical protein
MGRKRRFSRILYRLTGGPCAVRTTGSTALPFHASSVAGLRSKPDGKALSATLRCGLPASVRPERPVSAWRKASFAAGHFGPWPDRAGPGCACAPTFVLFWAAPGPLPRGVPSRDRWLRPAWWNARHVSPCEYVPSLLLRIHPLAYWGPCLGGHPCVLSRAFVFQA